MQNYAPGTDETFHIATLARSRQIELAFGFITRMREELDAELVRICEIPAPPFKEEARARYIADKFKELGLAQVRSDEEGNVIAERPGLSSTPKVVVSAHLDTVFPEGTDVRVRRLGSAITRAAS